VKHYFKISITNKVAEYILIYLYFKTAENFFDWLLTKSKLCFNEIEIITYHIV